MTIITARIDPPVPSRAYDWTAYVEGEEESLPAGYGPTEAEALKNLAEMLADRLLG